MLYLLILPLNCKGTTFLEDKKYFAKRRRQQAENKRKIVSVS
jgi:hypothetical protein